MSTLETTPDTVLPAPLARRTWLNLYMELAKARLSFLVVITTAVGYTLGAVGTFSWPVLLCTIAGTSLAAAAASAFNQLIEVDRDARMQRTRNRPLPSRALSRRHAFLFGVATAYLGLTILAGFVNLLSAALALLTIVLYVCVYTPLKARSSLNTLVGAVCGAIPPMIGWAAATGSIGTGAWLLGALLFVWQLPHFLSLAWVYREDYDRGGFVMLPKVDHDGRLTCTVVLMTALVLLPIGLLMTTSGVGGVWFALGSLLLGSWMALVAFRMGRALSDQSARSVFRASIIYLPLLLLLVVIDRGPIHGVRSDLMIVETFAAAPADTAWLETRRD